MLLKCILLSLFMHCLDDFVLQPITLSKLKQKTWWIKQCKENGIDFSKYKNDYRMALFIHSISWSISILFPIIFILGYPKQHIIICLLVANIICHYIIDDSKANKMKLNLVTDQLFHLLQIFITYLIVFLF